MAASSVGRGVIDKFGLYQANLTTGTATISVSEEKVPTNLASTQVSVVEPYRVNLELADVTNIYKKGMIEEKGVGRSSF